VISLRTLWSAGENFGCIWEHLGVRTTCLAAPMTCMGALTTSLGAPITRPGVPTTFMGAPRITVQQSGKSIFFGNAAGAPGNHSNSDRSMIFNIHVFSLYSPLCIYIATDLHMVDWLQAVLESNSR
jgi:hypothetical protein